MRSFNLLEPGSLPEACEHLAAEPDAKLVAGGTALLTIIKQGLLRPRTLINLKKIPAATTITYNPGDGLRIGAMATIDAIEHAPEVTANYPALAEACHVVANIRIRNMATIGGNLAHADYQSDPPTVLAALNAKVQIHSAVGSREVDYNEFVLGSYETVLNENEIVSAIIVPPADPRLRSCYIKFTTGSSEERPCAGVAAFVRADNGIYQEMRLAVGAVGPKAARIPSAEAIAIGQQLSDATITAIASEAARQVQPIDDVHGPAAYKRHLVKVLAARAIRACMGNGGSKP